MVRFNPCALLDPAPNTFVHPVLLDVLTVCTSGRVKELSATTYSLFSIASYLEKMKRLSFEYRICIAPFASAGYFCRKAESDRRYPDSGFSGPLKESPLPTGLDPILFSVFHESICVANISWRASWSLPLPLPVMPTSSP